MAANTRTMGVVPKELYYERLFQLTNITEGWEWNHLTATKIAGTH